MKDFWISFLLTSSGGIIASFLLRYLARFAPDSSLDHSHAHYRAFHRPYLARIVGVLGVTTAVAAVLMLVALILVVVKSNQPNHNILLVFLSFNGLMIGCGLITVAGGALLKCKACGHCVTFQWTEEPKFYKDAKWGPCGPGGLYFDILANKPFRCITCGQSYILNPHQTDQIIRVTELRTPGPSFFSRNKRD